MIKKKTVVVVGAGASGDLGLPVGSGLKDQVARLASDSSSDRFKYLRSACHNYFKGNEEAGQTGFLRLSSLSDQIRSAASIDNFLDQHRDEVEMVVAAKMAIAWCLSEAEKSSKLNWKAARSGIIAANPDYFLARLLNIAVRGHQHDNIEQSLQNLHFIIFNYDRCVERYLNEWCIFRFGRSDLASAMKGNFTHVYGSLGDYFDPNEKNFFEEQGGSSFLNPHFELPRYVSKFSLFTEQKNSETSQKISDLMRDMEALIILGFGFEEQNMEFLEAEKSGVNVFATLYGMSPTNKAFLENDLRNRFAGAAGSVMTTDGKAAKLFDDCYHPITRAVGSL